LRLGLLGPLEIADAAGAAIAVTSPQQRRLLVVLALAGGAVVSVDQVIEALWGQDPPETAVQAVQVYVSGLRRALGGEAIRTAPPGYRLDADVVDVDVVRFERLVSTGGAALAGRRFGRAREDLEAALALWRGDALTGFADEELARAEATRLTELRLSAVEDRVSAQLELGEGHRLVAELHQLVQENPLRETLVAQLMLALYREGRQGEALAAYRTARERLADELGVDPGPALQDLEGRILRQTLDLLPAGGAAESLPVLVGATFGRDEDLDRVAGKLGAPGPQLVTLTGPGGVGKTRLAVETATRLAAAYSGGVIFVDLQDAATADLGLAAFGQALGVSELDGDIVQAVRARLASAAFLVVLDNFEQVLDLGLVLAKVTTDGCRSDLLVTSRAALRLDGEQTITCGPLGLPAQAETSPEVALASPAVQLFAARARAADPAFRLAGDNVADVAAVCRRLDGIPLAIELAAAQCRVMSPRQLAGRLGTRLLSMSTGRAGAPDRQRTLEGAIGWSHEIVGPGAGEVLTLFGAFTGGAALPALDAVAGRDVLDEVITLVDHSLLRRGAPDRYAALEAVRQYAARCLGQRPDADAVRDRHAAFFAGQVTELAAERADSQWDSADAGNLRTAADWSQTRDLATAVRVSYRLLQHLAGTGQLREAEQRATRLLKAPLTARDQIRLHLIRQDIAFHRGRDAESLAEVQATLGLARAASDLWGIARCTHALAWRAMLDGDLTAARQLSLQGTRAAEDAGDDQLVAGFLNVLGAVAADSGDHASAQEHFRDSARRSFAHGDSLGGMTALANLAEEHLCEGDVASCRGQLDVIRGLLRDVDALQVGVLVLDLEGTAALLDGEPAAAAGSFAQSLKLRASRDVETGLTTALGGVAAALWLAGRPEDAIALFAACERLAARNPAHEANHTLHLPLRRRFQAEAQAAVTKTAAARARQRLAALDAAMITATAGDMAASLTG
jgi:predicted ATPase/DNA-binding SARP family transcriptional activator